MSEQTDQLHNAIAGDRDALIDLLQAESTQLRQLIGGLLPRKWQALLAVDDVMQQTFTDAFLGITRFEPRGDGAFRAWLNTLARRNIQDAIRMLEADKRGGGHVPMRSPDESLDALVEHVAGSSTTPSRHVARSEVHQAMHAALDDLPEDHRNVVRAIDLEGRAIADVARSLERSAGAVYMLRARGHRWLGEVLRQKGHI